MNPDQEIHDDTKAEKHDTRDKEKSCEKEPSISIEGKSKNNFSIYSPETGEETYKKRGETKVSEKMKGAL